MPWLFSDWRGLSDNLRKLQTLQVLQLDRPQTEWTKEKQQMKIPFCICHHRGGRYMHSHKYAESTKLKLSVIWACCPHHQMQLNDDEPRKSLPHRLMYPTCEEHTRLISNYIAAIILKFRITDGPIEQVVQDTHKPAKCNRYNIRRSYLLWRPWHVHL